MTPDFSVILPTRGHCPFLGETVRSVLAGPGAIELLLVHDRREGEGDLDPEIVSDPRVRLLHPKITGVSNARNIALDEARGRLIAFIDDDDVWLPQHVEHSAALFDRYPETIMVGSNALVLETTTTAGLPADPTGLPRLYPDRGTGPVPLHDLLLENWFHPSTTMLRHDGLAPTDRFDTRLTHMEDYDLWLRLARRAKPIFDDRPGAIIRRHTRNASRDRRSMAEGSLRVLDRFLADHVAGEELSASERRDREGRLWRDLAYACLVEDDTEGARRAATEALQRLPLMPRNYVYLLASSLPASVRRALVFRGRRSLQAS